MKKTLRVAVIGTGFGARVQIPAFRTNPRVEVVAIGGGRIENARETASTFGIPYCFDDFRELVKADLDLVSIATPPFLHHPMTLAAVAEGKHVLCEKPMAMSVKEAEDMLAEAQRRGVVHVIDHETRLNPNRLKLKRLIAEGFVGEPRHALMTHIMAIRNDPTRPWNWWSDAEHGGGLLGAIGSHQIDYLRFLFGDVETAFGSLETYVKDRPNPEGNGRKAVTSDDFTSFSLRFRSGVAATVFLSAVAAQADGPRLEVWGDKGSLVLENERLIGSRPNEASVDLTEPESLTPPPEMRYDPLWGTSFIRLADHLVAAILDGKPVEPLATFADGLAVQKVLDEIRRTSSRLG